MQAIFTVCITGSMALAGAPDQKAGKTPSKKEAVAGSKIKVPPAYVAVIDVQKILLESKAAQDLRSQVDKQHRTDRDALEKQEDSLRDEQQSIEKQRSILSKEAYAEKVRAWEKKAAVLNREINKRRSKLEQESQRALADIQKELLKIVQEIALASNITMVVSTSQLVMAEKDVDITRHVLTMLNKRLEKVSLKKTN